MKNVSSAFREELKKDNRNYIKSADITLKSGTVLKVDNSDLWQNGMKLDTATSNPNSFDLGAIITGQLTLTLNNIDEKFSDYDFTDCTATNVKVGLKLPDGTTESLSYGKFYLNEAKYNGSIITLTFYDSIYKFDRPYSKSSLSYPATLRQIVQDACSVCGVTQGTFTFDQDDFVVQSRPDDSSITFRQVLQWVGQISCQYFYADVQGRLRMAWYDVGLLDSIVTDVEEGFLQDTAGEYVLDHNSEKINTLKLLSEPDDDVEESPYDDTMFHEIESFTSLTTGLDDVVITGIRIIQEVDSEDGGKENITIQYGTDGYVLGIEGNKFITEENASDVAAMVGIKTIGMQFRSFSANALSDPTIEPGDVVLLIDRKKKRYKSIVTNNTFHPGNFQAFSCGAKSPIRNSSTRFSQITQVYTDYRKELSQQRTDIETALAELDDRIENSSGLFTTIEEQPDGSKKYFLHDKPLLSDSEIVWSMTAEAWGVSTDGGKTQNAGMTVDGDTIVRILTAVGINANWINTGALTIEKNGQVMFKADVDTGQVDIVANSFSLRGQTIDEIAQGEVNEFVNGVYAPTLNEIQTQIDQKTETWYQPTDPSLQWTETEESAIQDTTGADILDTNGEQIIGILEIGKTVHEGDRWKNSDTNVEYIYQDGQWIEMPIPDAVFDEIDGKARIFVTTPVPPYSERDLWMQGPDGDIMTCVHGRESGSFVSSDWEVKQKYTDDTAVGELDLALDKQGVFDRLTNYGEVKGIFLESDGQLYINASYLMTGILKVSQPGASGKETFYANMDTGEVRIVANSFSLRGQTIDEIAQGEVNEFVNGVYAPTLNEIQTQIDQKTETWYQPTDPSLQWTETEESAIQDTTGADILDTNGEQIIGILEIGKTVHEGDRWKNSDTNVEYIYQDGQWIEMPIPDAVFDEIDGKARIFVTTPVPPYSERDLWMQGPDGDIMTCVHGRESGSFVSSDWEVKQKYTDDTAVGELDLALDKQGVFDRLTNYGEVKGIFLESDGQLYINASYLMTGILKVSQPGASGKETFYANMDTGEVRIVANSFSLRGQTIDEIAQGAVDDLDDSLTQTDIFNRLTGNKANEAIILQNGHIYINASYLNTGILQVSTASGTETLYVNVDTGEVRINATSFSLTDGRTIDSIADNAKSEAIQYTDERLSDYDPADDLTQQEVFNILTNGGITQGIYLNGGRVYVNASYIGAGTLDADRIDAKGLTVYNTSGTRTLYIDNNGNVSINANSLMLSGSSVNSIANNAANNALQDAKDYTDMQIENFDPDLTQQEVFNILTNGGTTQGIYLSGGKIYINATYIGSGTISASRIAADSITASKLSISDLYAIGATIGGFVLGSQGMRSSDSSLRLWSDGRIQIGACVLSANSNAFQVRYGLHIYCDPSVFSDGSGYFKIFNLAHVTSGGHLVFNSDGATVAYLSSSSKRYKNHISDVPDEEALRILDIPVIKFKYKDGYLFPTDFLVDKEIPGFYAEDVEEVNPILCQYNEDGSVEDWNYRTMIPYMLKTMQIQQKQIDNLQTQINELKTMILNMKGA